jgi:enterochelin esterase family protein
VLKTELPIILWSSEDAAAGKAAPLVVAHDGSEYANLASLLSLLARHGPVRAALLDPVIDRDEIYSASATYARALSSEVLPALAHQAPASIRIGMGASLGALAMLHAQRLRPSSSARCSCSPAASSASAGIARSPASPASGASRASSARCSTPRARPTRSRSP